ncbi:hypothetical protein BCR33DRAFT_813124 [Rhizoclosmatium globosum]|uniref:C2H2-type domain-containing protein n=1 Tax=Rhizoclosmatium globosum TaxID=329046 RepID=A0A1Y2AII1_9FUNG|nr:hypothetical protein BCR33DRAFT_813124 [Rhizoclosmatium globosum]|eukprot:ORY22398.1 hypothetical protein BCR33DRAFT_813124 [Rhizoclosmatium globosum]
MFKCNKCSYADPFPEKLQKHVKITKCGVGHPARHGFMCLDCPYVCVTERSMKLHCRTKHSDNPYWAFKPTLVTKVHSSIYKMFKPEEGFDARQRAKQLQSLARKQKKVKNTAGSRSKAYLSTGLETAGLIASSSKTNTPFLNNMGWDKLVFGVDAIKNPANYIALLKESKDTKAVFVCCRLFLEKVNELASLPGTQPTRTAIKNAGRKVFKAIDVKTSIPIYTRTLGLFVVMLIARMEGKPTGTKLPKLREEVNEAVDEFVQSLDVPLLCRTDAVFQNQQQALVKLLRIVLFEDIGFDGLDTSRIHLVEEFLMLKFLQSDGTFCKEQLMTGPCTHILFASRCLVLDWCQEIASFGSWMQKAEKENLPYAKMKQFKSVCGLIVMGSNTANLISKHWDYSLPNEPKLVIDNRVGISKTMFREGCANYFQVISEDLDSLLYGMDVTNFKFDPTHLTDNVANTTPGYSFMTDAANSTIFTEANGNRLEEHLRKKIELRAMFFVPGRYYTTVQVDKFISLLMLGLTLFCGMPPRTTEFQMTSIVNSGLGKRNLMILEHRLCINLRYNKSSANSGYHKDVFRFVPDKLAQILMKYLVFVYPLYTAFWADMRIRKKMSFLTHEEEIHAKTYLFLRNGVETNVKVLHRLYMQSFWNIFGVNLGIRHTRQMMASFADDIDFEEAAAATVNETVSRQFGHSSRVHQLNYGATTDGAAVIRKMKSISDKWWHWCCLVGEVDSQGTLPVSRSRSAGTGSGVFNSVVIDVEHSDDAADSDSSDGGAESALGDGNVDQEIDSVLSESTFGHENTEEHEFCDEDKSESNRDCLDKASTSEQESVDGQEIETDSRNDGRLDPRYPKEFNDPNLATFYSMIFKYLDDNAEALGYNNTPSEDEAWATDYDDDDDDDDDETEG